ncbi:MAG: bifunctional chorismate mutase/prephenate dehydratase [Clostridiales bacterium]|jgi:chorismate mutase/prephenate dehydratase|nr:bifunctional chorismate mutase/prephenate dehydratase [Clostridiales bacterium]
MELKKLRDEIDNIDDQLAILYKKRMEIARAVAEVKKENNTPIENSVREKEIINRVTSEMPDDIKLYAKEVFTTVFSTSKAYQSQMIDMTSKTVSLIKESLEKGLKSFPISATVACQGIPGSYASIAAERLFKISSIMHMKNWDAVFNAVQKGLCEYGVLPIENSSVGSVNAVYDLMRKHKCYIVRGIKLKVQHYLLANKGASIENIKEIYSHEQAISQCSEFLKGLGDIKINIVDNTAVSAQLVKESGRNDICCIASRECAGIYGLSILEPNIQNSDSNFTRFIAIAKDFKVFEGANKISIMVNLPHEAGSLNKLLTRFSTLGLNLTKLESRPMSNSPFEFSFYFDFEANLARKEVQNLIAELENINDKFVFLGGYSEVM